MISPGHSWPGVRLLKVAFQQPARRLRAIGTMAAEQDKADGRDAAWRRTATPRVSAVTVAR